MASKLGPFFAIHAKANVEWTSSLRAQSDTQVVLECENRSYIVDIFNENFRKKLTALPTGSNSQWIFLAQILREDEEVLFAFEDPRERSLFEELREIDGIGPKSAALLIGKVGLEGFRKLIYNPKEIQTLKIPGMGSKSLEKVSLGLKQKQEGFLLILGEDKQTENSTPSLANFGEVPTDLEKALLQLGLKNFEVKQVFQTMLKENSEALSLPVNQMLQEALQVWGRSRSSRNMSTKELS